MIVNSLLVGAIVFLCMSFVSSPAIKLLVGIPVGMVSYYLMAFIRKDDSLSEIMNIVKNKVFGK